MRIIRLGLHGFGKFQNRTLELSSGLNVIYGKNEAGKSTLLRFILGMLYGFGGPTAEGQPSPDDRERYLPWYAAEYRGTLVYQLATGEAYRIERNFDSAHGSVQLFDERSGEEVTALFPRDRRGEPLFAEEQLGLAEEAFTSTAWVGQMAVNRVEMANELLRRVANLQQAGREDLSVERTLQALATSLREIGDERSGARPYGRTVQLLREKEERLARATAVREEALGHESRLRALEEQARTLDQRLAEARRHLQWAELHAARRRLAKAEVMGDEVAAVQAKAAMLARWAPFPVDQRDLLLRLDAEAEGARAHASRLRERLQEAEAAQAALAQEREAFEALTEMGPDVAAQVSAAFERLEELGAQLLIRADDRDRFLGLLEQVAIAMEPLHAAAERGDEVLVQVEALEQELEALSPQADEKALARLLQAWQALLRRSGDAGWWLLAPAAVFGYGCAALSVSGLPLGQILSEWMLALGVSQGQGAVALGGGAALLLGGVLWQAWSQSRRRAAEVKARAAYEAEQARVAAASERLRQLERERESALLSVGATTLAELRGRLVRHEQLAARGDGQKLRLEAVQAEMRRLEEEMARLRRFAAGALARWLGTAEAEVVLSPAVIEQFAQAAEGARGLRDEWQALSREAEAVAAMLQEEEARALAAETERDRLLTEAGVSSLAAFSEGVAQQAAYLAASVEAERLTAIWQVDLAGDTQEALEDQVHQLAQGVQGEEPEQRLTVAQASEQISALEAERAGLAARMGEWRGRVETALKELPNLADLAREVAALDAEREGYEREIAALELARQVITDASAEMEQEFAPALNQVMGSAVYRLTAGAYKAVRVDEQAGLRVATAGDRWVDVHRLSSGTIDQFYFALRFGLIDLITGGQEPLPLILDDPFVQYDEGRLAVSMRFLAEQSRTRQIILCTCHERETWLAQELRQVPGLHVSVVSLTDTEEG